MLRRSNFKLYRVYRTDFWGTVFYKKKYNYHYLRILKTMCSDAWWFRRKVKNIFVPRMRTHGKRRNLFTGVLLSKRLLKLFFIGIKESQLRKLFNVQWNGRGNFREFLLVFLEMRLPHLLWRTGLCYSPRQAKQFILHKHLLINKNICNYPNKRVVVGDLITFEGSKFWFQPMFNSVKLRLINWVVSQMKHFYDSRLVCFSWVFIFSFLVKIYLYRKRIERSRGYRYRFRNWRFKSLRFKSRRFLKTSSKVRNKRYVKYRKNKETFTQRFNRLNWANRWLLRDRVVLKGVYSKSTGSLIRKTSGGIKQYFGDQTGKSLFFYLKKRRSLYRQERHKLFLQNLQGLNSTISLNKFMKIRRRLRIRKFTGIRRFYHFLSFLSFIYKKYKFRNLRKLRVLLRLLQVRKQGDKKLLKSFNNFSKNFKGKKNRFNMSKNGKKNKVFGTLSKYQSQFKRRWLPRKQYRLFQKNRRYKGFLKNFMLSRWDFLGIEFIYFLKNPIYRKSRLNRKFKNLKKTSGAKYVNISNQNRGLLFILRYRRKNLLLSFLFNLINFIKFVNNISINYGNLLMAITLPSSARSLYCMLPSVYYPNLINLSNNSVMLDKVSQTNFGQVFCYTDSGKHFYISYLMSSIVIGDSVHLSDIKYPFGFNYRNLLDFYNV